MTKNILLKAEGITKTFSGVPALIDGRLKLRAGSVHALCGGNGAGKSTLLNILMGSLKRDGGIIYVDGHEVTFERPSDALSAGIAMINQELEPIPEMTVAENIYLGREPRRLGWIDFRKMRADAQQVLSSLNLDISPNTKIGKLSIADIQMVEIAKAISQNAKIIIMDEPTSAIGDKETETLFSSIEKLKEKGTGIIYVSHRMNELYRIADEYTIMRDGTFIESASLKNVDRDHIITTILGKQLNEEYLKYNKKGEKTVLEVKNYSREKDFFDISLDLKEGEILGIFGLMGSGRSEFLDALFGANPAEKGKAYLHGKLFNPKHPIDALNAGIAYVTEDRKSKDLITSASVRRNITLASVSRISHNTIIHNRIEDDAAMPLVNQLEIKANNLDVPVKTMSGGNQQKVVFAKWLNTQPDIMLLDEPTRGVDVGAKREIYSLMSEFANEHRAIIMTSSEIPEILGMSDRVIVFRKGKISGELSGDRLTQDNLTALS